MNPLLKHIFKRIIQGLIITIIYTFLMFIIGYLCFLLPLSFIGSLELTILISFIIGLIAFAYIEFHMEANKK